MKEIKRKNHASIIKKEIDLNNLVNYESLDLKLITHLLNEVITENIFSTIDLLKLLKDNYHENITKTIKKLKDYSSVRFNCCYATIVLKNKLEKLGIDTKIISYKSIGFSSPYGDDLIKEAHMAILIPTIRHNKICYIILDPGLRIPAPIEFFANSIKTVIEIDNDEIIIEKTKLAEYPYSIEIKGYNRYSTNDISYQCKEFFDTKYETINPLDILFPIAYEILEGYRMINYTLDNDTWASIKIMVINQYLECIDQKTRIKISFSELKQMEKSDLIKILVPFKYKLNTDVEELVDIIFFTIEHSTEFLSMVINKNVVKEIKNR